MASLHDTVWAMCMCGIMIMASFMVPSIGSEYLISLLVIHVCALTFGMVMLYRPNVVCCTMDVISSSYGWLCWEGGCLMWLLIK